MNETTLLPSEREALGKLRAAIGNDLAQMRAASKEKDLIIDRQAPLRGELISLESGEFDPEKTSQAQVEQRSSELRAALAMNLANLKKRESTCEELAAAIANNCRSAADVIEAANDRITRAARQHFDSVLDQLWPSGFFHRAAHLVDTRFLFANTRSMQAVERRDRSLTSLLKQAQERRAESALHTLDALLAQSESAPKGTAE